MLRHLESCGRVVSGVELLISVYIVTVIGRVGLIPRSFVHNCISVTSMFIH